MKYLVALISGLLLWGSGTLASAVLLPQNPQQLPAVNEYYIGVHSPDGSCETLEVFANSLEEAERIVKEQRCPSCVLTDETSEMTTGDPARMASATRFCPLR